MAKHPEFEAEQAHIRRAHEYLEKTRADIETMRDAVEGGRGGTFQSRFERDVMWDRADTRLSLLDIGDLSLVFGRIDTDSEAEAAENGTLAGLGDKLGFSDAESPSVRENDEAFYIGRLAVSNEDNDPVVVDWRTPMAEKFYRATGVDPLGLSRRRHFATRGQELLGIDDELFGSATQALDTGEVQGQGALFAALEESRSGRLSDIVGTIQAEQDRIIRSELPGILVVQGGPGTGKTVVALHRAAFLLYAHRFPLEGQGVLVIGPNRVFLSYIEQVLPSLGEAGVKIAQLADLVPHIRATGFDDEVTARVKGDLRMIDVVRKAVRDRQRPLREPLRLAYGVQHLSVSVEESAEIIKQGRRRFRTHNAARKMVEQMLFERLAESSRKGDSVEVVRDRTRQDVAVREALEWMWPVLTPTELLNDFMGLPGLLRSAAQKSFEPAEYSLLTRTRLGDPGEVVFSHNDVPLLDEALELLGPRPKHIEEDSVRTYGHIVIDEAQDLSPMHLRVIDRRSLNGSMTLVGDIAQSTGAWPHDDWESIVDHLPQRRVPRREELTVGYRLPGPIMDLAAKVLSVAAPQLKPPISIRKVGDEPKILAVGAGSLSSEIVELVRFELTTIGHGNLAIAVPPSMTDSVSDLLSSAGIDHGKALRQGLDKQITVVTPTLLKGLELDSVIVVEPQRILDEQDRGPQSLYVAVTRSTKRLTIVHTGELPAILS